MHLLGLVKTCILIFRPHSRRSFRTSPISWDTRPLSNRVISPIPTVFCLWNVGLSQS